MNISDRFNDKEIGMRSDLTALRIDGDPQIPGRPDAFLGSRQQSARNCIEQYLTLNALFALHVVQNR